MSGIFELSSLKKSAASIQRTPAADVFRGRFDSLRADEEVGNKQYDAASNEHDGPGRPITQ